MDTAGSESTIVCVVFSHNSSSYYFPRMHFIEEKRVRCVGLVVTSSRAKSFP